MLSVTRDEVVASLATLPDKCSAHADVGASPEAVVSAVAMQLIRLSGKSEGSPEVRKDLL